MKNLSAIILITAFIAAQYARQVSYLECKLSNTFKTAAEKCDCEKIMSGEDDMDTYPVPVPHNHVHVDESYLPGYPFKMTLFGTDDFNYCIMPVSALSKGLYGRPDRPPADNCPSFIISNIT